MNIRCVRTVLKTQILTKLGMQMPKPKMLIKPTKTSKQRETNLKYMKVEKYTRKMGLVTGK